jgi:hypothetical protein
LSRALSCSDGHSGFIYTEILLEDFIDGVVVQIEETLPHRWRCS